MTDTDPTEPARPPSEPGTEAALDSQPTAGHRAVGGGRWFWAIVALATIGVVWHALVGLVLAMAGSYTTWLTVLLSVALTAASWPWVRRAAPANLNVGGVQPVLMIVIAVGLFVYSADNIGQHVFTGRDPGSYLTTARWLADQGTLRADVSVPELDDVPGVSYAGPAVYEVDDGVVEFQFSHGASISMATAFDLVGPRGLFASAAAVGSLALLAVYLALTTVTRSPWLALAGATGLGVSLPFLFVTRNTYSEPFVLLVGALALAVLLADGRHLGRPQLALVGFLLGSTMLFRIDAQLYVIGLLAIGSYLILCGAGRLAVGSLVGAAVVPIVVGTIDVRYYAGTYASALSRNVGRLDAAAAGALVVLVVLALVLGDRGAGWFRRPGNARVAIWVGAAVAVLGILAWQVRPYVLPATKAPQALVGGLQRKYGLPEDPTRSYSELSVESISWYLGAPLVALAIAGFALIVARVIADRRSRFWPAALLMAIGIPIYLITMKITPDQLWASRRFVPFIIPAFVIAAVWGADRLVRFRAFGWHERAAVLTVLCLALAAPAAATTWPIRGLNEQRGALGAMDALCSALDEEAAVIDLDSGYFSMPIRAWCGADAVRIAYDDAESIELAVEALRDTCVDAYFVTGNGAALEQLGGDLASIEQYAVVNPFLAERTLDKPPGTYMDQTVRWALGRVALPASCG